MGDQLYRKTQSWAASAVTFNYYFNNGNYQPIPSEVSFYFQTSIASTFVILSSIDGVTYRQCDTYVFAAPGEVKLGYKNTDNYIRVTNSTVGNHTVEITATRG